MALINKIREKSGIAVGIIAVGLLLFVLGGDLLRSGAGGQGEREVGEIAGQTVSLEEYQQTFEELKVNFMLQNGGQNPSEAQLNTLRDQAWNMMIIKKAFQEQYDALGIEVTEAEMVDMVQGKNIRPEIRQSFTNPQTGRFDKNRLLNYLQNIQQMPAQQQASWYSFEETLKPSRMRVKYDNLLLSSVFITDAEAAMQHKMENSAISAKYLYVPFTTISDTAVEVSDSELRSYINDHEKEYQVEESRSLSYVAFSITPSAQDSAYYMQDLTELKTQFAAAKDDSIYAAINTDGGAAYRKVTLDQLPPQLGDNPNAISAGDVKGPFQLGNSYYLYKVADIGEADKAVAKASHILIKAKDDSPAEERAARNKARDILKKARAGQDFAKLARENSEGPSGPRGGDLGWFAEGRMVDEFNEVVFETDEPGIINKVVKTQFGYHVIKVDEAPTKTQFTVAVIRRDISPSDDTIDEAYKQADYFAASSTNMEEFTANAEEQGLMKRSATKLKAGDRRVGALGNARSVVRWLYSEAVLGEVSPVMELEDRYVVAIMTGRTEAGVADVATVKAEVSRKVKDQKKAEMIMDKLSGSTLEEMAENYGEQAKIYTENGLKLSSNSLPYVGFAPQVIGKAFGMKEGDISGPMKADNGVVVLELQAKTDAQEVADYASYKKPIKDKLKSRESYNINEAIRENAKIEDRRYNFF